jgi:hypothetical protein
MYWKMIVRLTALVFILTFLAPIPFSVVEGFLRSAGKDVPAGLYLGKSLAELLAIGAVFTLLADTYSERILAYSRSKEICETYHIAPDHYSFASVQTKNPWTIINHAFFVVLFTWLCSFLLNVILFGLPLLGWAYSIVPVTSMAAVGLLVGLALRRRRERAAIRRQTESAM